jgi:hypothetical protein
MTNEKETQTASVCICNFRTDANGKIRDPQIGEARKKKRERKGEEMMESHDELRWDDGGCRRCYHRSLPQGR